MEDFVKTLRFSSEGSIQKEVWNAIQSRLNSENGVKCELINSNQLSLSFPSHSYSNDYISNLLQESGFRRKSKARRSVWERLLNNIVKGNKEAFGDQHLECCKLNK